jgi:hypothetical protein
MEGRGSGLIEVQFSYLAGEAEKYHEEPQPT